MTEAYALISIVHGLIGATGALSVIVLIYGFSVYFARLGTVRREEGIHIIITAIGLIIGVLFLIGILRLLERWFA